MPWRISFPAPCTAIVSVTRMEASGCTAMSLWYDRMRSSCARAVPLTASSNSGASHGRRIMPDPSAVAVHRLWREGRHADRDVLRTLRLGRAVLHPLAAPRDDGLSRAHVDRPAGVLHAQQALQHDRVLVELGRLPRLDPAGGGPPVRGAPGPRPRARAADVLLDLLRHVARGDDARGLGDVLRHGASRWAARTRARPPRAGRARGGAS